MISNQNVSKVYKMGEVDLTVLKDLNLQIKHGEFVAIVGPSGSGKSTVLNLLGCLDKPTDGKIFIDETDVTQLDTTALANFRGENIGFIFQSFNLIPVLSVYENIEYPLIMIQNLPEKERRERIMTLLKDVDMLDQKDKFPDQLSGGQRQRVAIARALVTKPKIVFADEPTANLDTHTSNQIITLMRNIQKEFNTTFIFATHDEKIVTAVDRIITLVDGVVTDDKRVA
ncbi:ABC transporter ATP-binding protein [Candidatus Sulfurimonas marisnigri]|uniref:ABC transporter ATP-binding protein n=1 Tax=Candidatus Sulfurimonas marisnigri TaxID=2740405 RepID=A0A7S7RPR1_9BACT|nr:ABC transporter ATP-binding protein [Candidatus Sulfurimonas marisnigri]QOY53891.1 ABC transporter ATP-binding protein [Candidatus Sulfurimonas marisnigri]